MNAHNRYTYCLNNPLTYTNWTNGSTQAQGVTISYEYTIAYVLAHPESISGLRALANSGANYVEIFEDGKFLGKHWIEAVYCFGKRKQSNPQGQGGLSNEDRIVLLANMLAMKELGLNPKDIQSYGSGSSLYSKLSKLNNPQVNTKGWSKAFNSSSKKFDALISPEIGNTGLALKYYPTKNGFNDALGLVRTGEIGHYIETRLEIEEAFFGKYLNLGDDWLYDMHLYNSILFINSKP